MLKVKTINLFYESEKLKNNLEKIDPANIIKEALSLGETNIRQLSDDKEETLNLIYNKTIKSYLEAMFANMPNTPEVRRAKDVYGDDEGSSSLESLLSGIRNHFGSFAQQS